MRYESESKVWSTAAAIVRGRVRAMPEFSARRREIVAEAVAFCRGRDVAAMRAVGGFSAVLARLVDASPAACHVNVGSKLIPTTVASELNYEIAGMREDVQRTLASELARNVQKDSSS
jgi:hypothetical protein